jgi:peptidoglycan/xylan/chitin deacetylase (PgdA/CDA1 family)
MRTGENRRMREALKGMSLLLSGLVPDSLARAMLGQFFPIFVLHRIREDDDGRANTVAHVDACLAYVRKRGFNCLSLTQLESLLGNEAEIPRNTVIFTADDGFKDQAEIAGPLFARYDVPLTCFVITDFLDGRLWPWDDQVAYVIEHTNQPAISLALPDGTPFSIDLGRHSRGIARSLLRDLLKRQPQATLYAWLDTFYAAAGVEQPATAPIPYRAMSWEDAKTFSRLGHTIAPHSCTHRILSQLSDTESREEIVRSVARVNEVMASKPSIFAYPTGRTGDFGARESGYLREAGITLALSTESRTAVPGDALLALPRYSLPRNIRDFAQCLSFIEVAKERMRRRPRAL